MANVPILSGAGATVYLKAAGAGSDADPFVPEHSLGAGTNNIGDTDVLTLVGDSPDLDSGAGTDNHAGVAILLPASGGHVIGGTETDPIRTDPVASTVQPVSIASMHVPVTVIASIPNVPSVAIVSNYLPEVTASVIGNPAVIATVPGVVAVAIASNNVPVSGRATIGTPTPVGDGALAGLRADTTGALVMVPYTNAENILNKPLKGSGATTGQVLFDAQGSGYRAYITDWQVVNPSGSHGTDVCLHDGTTTLAVGHAAKDGGGFAFRFVTPLKPAPNATVSLFAATASSPLTVNVSGFKGV